MKKIKLSIATSMRSHMKEAEKSGPAANVPGVSRTLSGGNKRSTSADHVKRRAVSAKPTRSHVPLLGGRVGLPGNDKFMSKGTLSHKGLVSVLQCGGVAGGGVTAKEQGTRGFNKCGVWGGVKAKLANEQLRPEEDCMVDQVKNRKRKLREVFGQQVTQTKKRSTHSVGCRDGGHDAGEDGGGGRGGEMSKIDVLLQQAKIIQLMDDAQEEERAAWKKEKNLKKRKGGGGGGGVGPPQRPVKRCVTHVPTACHAANADPMIKGGEEHRCNRVGTFERALLELEVRVATAFLSLSLCSAPSLLLFPLLSPLHCHLPHPHLPLSLYVDVSLSHPPSLCSCRE